MGEWRRRKKPRRPTVYRRAAFKALVPAGGVVMADPCRCAHPAPRSEGPLLVCGVCARVVVNPEC